MLSLSLSLSQEQDITKVFVEILLILVEFGREIMLIFGKLRIWPFWGHLPGPGDSLHFNILSHLFKEFECPDLTLQFTQITGHRHAFYFLNDLIKQVNPMVL